MENVNFLNVEIVFDGEITNDDLEQGFGAITLSKGGREYILDVVGSNWIYELDQTNVSCEIEVDEETFPDCKFDLTSTDLFSCNLKSTIFIGDFSNELISATLFVRVDGKSTKAINLELE